MKKTFRVFCLLSVVCLAVSAGLMSTMSNKYDTLFGSDKTINLKVQEYGDNTTVQVSNRKEPTSFYKRDVSIMKETSLHALNNNSFSKVKIGPVYYVVVERKNPWSDRIKYVYSPTEYRKYIHGTKNAIDF